MTLATPGTTRRSGVRRPVVVTLAYRGLTGSDLAYEEGPNGWTYRLERSTAAEPWTITDHGNG